MEIVKEVVEKFPLRIVLLEQLAIAIQLDCYKNPFQKSSFYSEMNAYVLLFLACSVCQRYLI